MKTSIICLFLALVFLPITINGQSITAAQVLANSMDYHDPDRKTRSEEIILTLNEPRPGGEDRISVLTFNTNKNEFALNRKTGETEVEMKLIQEAASFQLNGSSNYTREEADEHRLDAKRLKMLRNYYQYLWFLPMKLEDPGTIIDPEVVQKDFFGKAGLQIRVTYDPEVGKDIWYFYFHPESYALIGYRFYHDESKNDGEYILIEDEVKFKNIRLPKTRKWYKHENDKYLGMDVLQKIEF